MKRFFLPLSRGRTVGGSRVEFVVDDQDAWLLRNHSWSVRKNKNTFVVYRANGGCQRFLAHDILNVNDSRPISHADGDSLNFRRDNLLVHLDRSAFALSKRLLQLKITPSSSPQCCVHGHPMYGKNLYVSPKGQRYCRACNEAAVSKYRNKSEAACPPS